MLCTKTSVATTACGHFLFKLVFEMPCSRGYGRLAIRRLACYLGALSTGCTVLIEISLLDGTSITIAAASVIRLRPSFGANEPPDTTVVDCGRNPIFTREGMGALAGRLGAFLQLLPLTAPNGVGILVDGRKVSSIVTANDADAPTARAKLTVGGRLQFVRETPQQVQALIGDAPGVA